MTQFKKLINLLVEIKLKGQLRTNKTEIGESEGIWEASPTPVA